MLKAKKTRRQHDNREEAIADVTKEETKRLNVDIPISLHNEIKIQAIKEGNGATISSIAIKALNEYLSEHSDD